MEDGFQGFVAVCDLENAGRKVVRTGGEQCEGDVLCTVQFVEVSGKVEDRCAEFRLPFSREAQSAYC